MLLVGTGDARVRWSRRTPADWDRELGRWAGATAFHEAAFLTAFADLRGWRLELLAAEVAGEAVGLVPLLLARRGPVRVPAPTPFPFLGPVVDDHHLRAVVAAAGGWAGRRGAVALRVDRRSPTPAQVLLLEDAGVEVGSPRTWVVDLGPGDPAAAYNRNTRRALRTAEQAGVTVGPVDAATAARVLPQLLGEAYAAHGASDPYAALGPAGWERLVASHPGALVHAAHLDGRCVGVLVTLVRDRTAYVWVGGCLREVRDARANFALHAHVLDEVARRGCTSADLVGEVDERVARFKAGLGARPEPFVLGMRPTAPVRLARRVAGR
ncbi:Acetyltransferase (GNAT) domain-containing protein [Nocardioides scoriae]|uniref:Acetyltransferase (GNAT) domain-containing protein n=1 Tax=Nocardioides scoriae TaxID=642780 RepID=A0A1H1TL03_9ACTN|nr:GNAT family N-acetyltransferase [Nocardioides scoriae]SDS60656.1 Acetyltransferase (GNAT) domain-containing protein [Nocardioides scoriae]